MNLNWKEYCYKNKLPSYFSKEDAINHYLSKNPAQTSTLKSNNTTQSGIESKNLEAFRFLPGENKNLIFLYHTIPTPDIDSGSRRIIEILKIIISLNYNVYYLTHDDKDKSHYVQNLYNLGIKKVLVADPKNNKYLHNHIEDLCFKEGLTFQVAIFEFYEMYCEYWEKIKYFVPNIKTIVDSVDVHWVRKLSNPNNTQSDIENIQIQKNQEKKAYIESNVVFAVTEEDKAEILKECPTANIKILSNIHTLDPDPPKENTLLHKSKDLIFVGGDNHTPNTDAALKAIDIFQLFIKKYPEFQDSKLHIVGKRTNQKILSHSKTVGIVIHNQLSDDELKNLYQSVYAALCPITWGSGIKGKVCEAISKFLPVITTNNGAAGLNLIKNQDAFISDSDIELIEHIHDVFSLDSGSYINMIQSAARKLSFMTSVYAAQKVLDGTLNIKPIVISIVTYNNSYLLQKCLDSIINKTSYPNYKIYVTSNACVDNTPQIMKFYTSKYANIFYQYNNENKHFLQAHNEAISLYPDSDMVLLNEDIEIISDSCWLSNLYSSVYSAGYVGCAGGKTIYPNGTICEAGAQLYNNGRGENIGRHKNPDEKAFNTVKYVGYVSGCMMYMRRDCIEQFGSMDMRYYPCYYEDSDWQYNLHINGYKTVYNPAVVAIHREGSSCGTDIEDEKGFKKFMKINRTKFLEKYSTHDIEKYNS